MVGAERELHEMVEGLDPYKLRDFCAERSINWLLAAPAAPHQNGCAEALAKSCKRALKKANGEHILSPFELYTCLLEVGNLVNQRSIGRVPNTRMMANIYAQTTCFLKGQHWKFLKAHSTTQTTRDAV